jgi:cell division protein FtsB
MKNSTLAGLMGGALALSLSTNGYLYYNNSKVIQNVEVRNQLRTYKDSVDIVFQNMQDSLEKLAYLQLENTCLAASVQKLETTERAYIAPRTITITKDPNEQTSKLLAEVKSLKTLLKEAGKPLEKVIKSSPKNALNKEDKITIAKYKELIEAKDAEISFMKSEIEELKTSREAYAVNYSKGVQSKYDALLIENSNLKERFTRGAIPQFRPITIQGGSFEDGVFIPSFKSKNIDRLKFNFSVLENPLITEPITEKVTLRLLNSSGAVISTKEINSSITNSNEVYTLKQDIMIDGNMQGNAPQTLWFPANDDLKDKLQKGKYKLELISRDKIRQITDFEII